MANKFNAALPVETIRMCISNLNGYRKELAQLMEQEKDYTAPDANKRYSQNHIDNELKRITLERDQIMQEAAAKVRNFRDIAVNELKDAYVPSGEDVTGMDNEADAALFEKGLILDAKTLEYILSKHDNAAFRIMADKYAKERQWDGFEYVTAEDSAKEYINQVFDGLAKAAADPFNYSAIQYTETKGEYRRMADEYGLLAEFNKSNGDTIDTAIIEPLN